MTDADDDAADRFGAEQLRSRRIAKRANDASCFHFLCPFDRSNRYNDNMAKPETKTEKIVIAANSEFASRFRRSRAPAKTDSPAKTACCRKSPDTPKADSDGETE